MQHNMVNKIENIEKVKVRDNHTDVGCVYRINNSPAFLSQYKNQAKSLSVNMTQSLQCEAVIYSGAINKSDIMTDVQCCVRFGVILDEKRKCQLQLALNNCYQYKGVLDIETNNKSIKFYTLTKFSYSFLYCFRIQLFKLMLFYVKF